MNRLHDSPIEWQEAEQKLVLQLPPRVGRMARPLLGIAVFFAPLVLVVAFASNGWLFAVVGMAAVPLILLLIAYVKMRKTYVTDMQVTITPQRVIVKSNCRGQTTSKEFALEPRSHAWQWFSRQATSRSAEPQPQGIVIADQTYNPETGDDPNDRSKPRFGGNLTRGELDWVEWRINVFLDRNGHAAPPEPNESEKPSEPRAGLLHIEQDGFEVRIGFPNTVATASYTGVGSLLFGMVLLAICCVPLIFLWNDAERLSVAQLLLQLAYATVFGLLGLAATSNGLVQLFGRRQLTISPQRVRYWAGLLGIGVWWTLSTADIVSVWNPSKHDATRRTNKDIASAQGAVIRTVQRECPLRAVHEAVRSGVGAQWLADTISRHIVVAARRLS